MLNGLNKYQKTVLIIAWLGWVFDVMEASLFGLTKTQMMNEMLGANYAMMGTIWEGRIHAGMLLGWAAGGLIFGIVADKWGRTKTLILTIFLYCLFTGATALCQTPEQVLAARFLTGLGIGGEWAAGAALIAETVPNSFRPRAAALLQTAAAIGSICGVFLNMSIGSLNWRWVYLAGIIPAVICLVARYRLEHDTPGAKVSGEASPDSNYPRGADGEPTTTSEAVKNPLWSLLSTRPYNKRLLLVVIIGVVGITGGGILPFWLPNLIKPAVHPDSFKMWMNTSMIILHLGTLAGVLVFPPLTEKYGRRPMFMLFGAMSGIMLFLTATQSSSLVSTLILAPITSFFALGLTAGFGLYFTEVFSRAFRATGSGLAYNTGRLLAIPVPIWIGAQAKTSGVAAAIGPVALLYVLMIVALIFAPETRGKELEA
ncbi:MAG TPA: MFS transporter [Fimbriimonas sp.]|nr:MFS transporter [Fimbriimonas sp.]